MTVYLAQCLCGPQRHAILAAAGEADDWPVALALIDKPLRAQVFAMIEGREIKPVCGLCQSPASAWFYELGKTRFETLAAAMPALRESEQSQRALADMLAEVKGKPD